MKLLLKNVRCFTKAATEIYPLTILVGENSSGKSTFLGALAAVHSVNEFPGNPTFTHPPYDWGSFDSIATYRGGAAGRASYFSIGYEIPDRVSKIVVDAKYSTSYGKPRLIEFDSFDEVVKMAVKVGDKELTGTLSIVVDGKAVELSVREIFDGIRSINMDFLSTVIFRTVFRHDEIIPHGSRAYHHAVHFQRAMRDLDKAVSIAPIRSEPKRTYDRSSEEFDPQGDHVPFEMARIILESAPESLAEKLKNYLSEFGSASGLFKKIEPKRLGQKPGDPFKLDVTVVGRPANIKDVGYGVSQSLPVLVQSILGKDADTILMQQPEVHLHPKAQAELGSFFCHLVANENRKFVIETHSDYLIDRIRCEVAGKHLAPDKVKILYFAKNALDTRIHEISLDDQGNLLGAPEGYRSFFLDEQDRILNRGE